LGKEKKRTEISRKVYEMKLNEMESSLKGSSQASSETASIHSID
jgi:hypothetical protein